MSKSEYERLTDYFPDAVKVIREQVLDEATEAMANTVQDMTDKEQRHNSIIEPLFKAIENLKNK